MRFFSAVAFVATFAISATLLSCNGKSGSDNPLAPEVAPAIKMASSQDSILRSKPGYGVILRVYCNVEIPADSRELFELICTTALGIDSAEVKELDTNKLATYLANDFVNSTADDDDASGDNDGADSGEIHLPFYVDFKFKSVYNKNGLLSLCHSRVEMNPDYPRTEEYYNYNVKSCKAIDVTDLFDDTNIPKVQALLKPQLVKYMNDHYITTNDATEEDLAAEGFWNADNIQVNNNFSITDAGLVWHYQPGEIAEYSKGMVAIEVPYEMLKPLLRSSNPLAD